MRELHEELGLPMSPAPNDITLEPMPHVSETRMSPTYGLMTRVSFHMYRVILRQPYLAERSDVRWVRVDEVEAGRTSDDMGIAVGPLRIQAVKSGMRLVDLGGH